MLNFIKEKDNNVSSTIKLKRYFNDIAMYFGNIQLIISYTIWAAVIFFFAFIYLFGGMISANEEIWKNTLNALISTLQFKEMEFITREGIVALSGVKGLMLLTEDLINIILNALIFSVGFYALFSAAVFVYLLYISSKKNKDLYKDKVKRGGKLLENEEYIEFLKENKPEELEISDEKNYIELSKVYKVDEFKDEDRKKLRTTYNKILEEAKNKKDGKKILIKESNFIQDANENSSRFFKLEEMGSIKIKAEETFEHLAVSGSTGSGKSDFITNYIEQILKRFSYYDNDLEKRKKKKIVILDLGEEFATKFYNEKGWKKINPFSTDGYYINDFDYIQNELQITSMAEIRIKEEKGGGNSEYFTSIKRNFLKAAYAYCILKNKKENKYVYELLAKSRDDLVAELESTAEKTLEIIYKIEQKLINKSISEDSKYFLMNESEKYKFMKDLLKNASELIAEGQQGTTNYISLKEMLSKLTFLKLNSKKINIREWIAEDGDNLIVSVPLSTKAQSMTVAAAFMDILGRELLNIGENLGVDKDREIHLIIDEFTNISKINVLIELITLVRKYNVSILLSFQEISRIQLLYTKEELESLNSNIGINIFFQAGGDETQKQIQSKIGKQDLEYSLLSNNLGVDNNKDGANLNKQIQEKVVITEAEIQALRKFEFIYVKKGNSLKTDENKTVLISAKIQRCIDLSVVKEKKTDRYSKISDSLTLLDFEKLEGFLNNKEDEEKRKRDLLEKILKGKKEKKEEVQEEIIKEDGLKDLAYLDDFLEDFEPQEIDLKADLEEDINPYN